MTPLGDRFYVAAYARGFAVFDTATDQQVGETHPTREGAERCRRARRQPQRGGVTTCSPAPPRRATWSRSSATGGAAPHRPGRGRQGRRLPARHDLHQGHGVLASGSSSGSCVRSPAASLPAPTSARASTPTAPATSTATTPTRRPSTTSASRPSRPPPVGQGDRRHGPAPHHRTVRPRAAHPRRLPRLGTGRPRRLHRGDRRHRVVHIERMHVNDHLKVAGTPDRIALVDGDRRRPQDRLVLGLVVRHASSASTPTATCTTSPPASAPHDYRKRPGARHPPARRQRAGPAAAGSTPPPAGHRQERPRAHAWQKRRDLDLGELHPRRTGLRRARGNGRNTDELMDLYRQAVEAGCWTDALKAAFADRKADLSQAA